MTSTRVTSQISLEDLLAVPVPIAWHEAVAVVRVVAQLVLLDPHAQPDTAHTWLGDDGTLRLERPSPRPHHPAVTAGDAPAVESLVWPPEAAELEGVTAVEINRDGSLTAVRETPGHLVAALCALLGALLPESAPDGLRALADPTRIDVDAARPDTFIAALSVFARPDDDRELRALARRAVDLLESRARADALREMTERARVAPPPTTPEPEAPLARVGTHVRTVVIGAAVLASLAAAGVWRAVVSMGPPSSPAHATAAPVPPEAPRVGSERKGPPRASQGSAGRGSGGSRADQGSRRARGTDAPRAPADASRTFAGERNTFEGLSAVPVGSGNARELGADPAVAAAGTEQGLGVSVAPDHVYDSNDPDVVPPKILRAQMPERPIDGVASEPRGVLELLIDQTGAVQQARLVPDSRRLQDRLMVSAAKTWRFAAARRDGQPVRYRLRMPITS